MMTSGSNTPASAAETHPFAKFLVLVFTNLLAAFLDNASHTQTSLGLPVQAPVDPGPHLSRTQADPISYRIENRAAT